MTPVRLEPVAPQSRVKHSTTEPLRSLHVVLDGSIQLSTFVNWIFIPGVVVRKYIMHLKVASNWHNGMRKFGGGWQFGVVWWWFRVAWWWFGGGLGWLVGGLGWFGGG